MRLRLYSGTPVPAGHPVTFTGSGYTRGQRITSAAGYGALTTLGFSLDDDESWPPRPPWRWKPDIDGELVLAALGNWHKALRARAAARKLQQASQDLALGGVVPPDSKPPEKMPEVSSGLPGFSHAEFVAGTVHGYRWWSMDVPPLHLSPFAGQGAAWKPRNLRGQQDYWYPGENVAACKKHTALGQPHPDVPVPDRRCGCGFWAYWTVRNHDLGTYTRSLPVTGVVEGSGKVIIGPEGFRAARARIVAIYLPFLIHPDVVLPEDGEPAGTPPAPRGSLGRSLAEHPAFTGRVINYPGRDPDTGQYWSPAVPAPAEMVPPGPPPPSEEEIAESRDRAAAWQVMIGYQLGLLYPEAEICESMDYMKAKYPVVSEYPDT